MRQVIESIIESIIGAAILGFFLGGAALAYWPADRGEPPWQFVLGVVICGVIAFPALLYDDWRHR